MSDRRPTWTDLLTLAERLAADNARLQAEVDRLTQRVAELEADRPSGSLLPPVHTRG